ncbi:MAG: hypothetical protein WCP85_00525 [Mariniphaga sp.]
MKIKIKRILFCITAFSLSLQIAAQDLIYKKNGEIVKAKILGASDESLSYRLFNHFDTLTWVINTHAIDSIIYQNGIRTSFKKVNIVGYQPHKVQNVYDTHHLIGLDLAGYLIYHNLTFSYEYLPGTAKWGFKAAYAKQLVPVRYFDNGFNFARIPVWSTRLEINYYIFPVRTFRFGTGLSYIFGKYPSNLYYAPGSDGRNIRGEALSLFGFYNFNKYLAINPGFDIPLSFYPSSTISNTTFRCEILFNF